MGAKWVTAQASPASATTTPAPATRRKTGFSDEPEDAEPFDEFDAPDSSVFLGELPDDPRSELKELLPLELSTLSTEPLNDEELESGVSATAGATPAVTMDMERVRAMSFLRIFSSSHSPVTLASSFNRSHLYGGTLLINSLDMKPLHFSQYLFKKTSPTDV